MTLLTDAVVIAEDDPEISQMVKFYLERVYGLSVSMTDSVNGILPLVLETQASVLIMDLQLTDGDATQVLPDVAAIDDLLVVILTGTWDGRQEDQLLKDGAQVVMRKPQKPSAIWQQVLNLRGIHQKDEGNNLRIQVKGTKTFYGVKDGTIVGEDGTGTFFGEKRRVIMEILARSMTLNKKATKLTDGWISRKEIIREVFGQVEISSDIVNSFGYYIRDIKKTLGEKIACNPDVELLENRREGRSVSYYRLNPEIFEAVIYNSDE